MKNRTYSVFRKTVSTVKKSQASTPLPCARRNSLQVGPVPRGAELGLAHARDKPVLLLVESAEEGCSPLPFDIDNHFALEYKGVDETLTDRIDGMLTTVRETHVPGRYLRFHAR